MGQTIQQRQLKLLEKCRAADHKIETENRQRVKVGDVVKINLGTWGKSKAGTAIVVRTYKAPDNDILALPSSAEMYETVLAAIANGTLADVDRQAAYSQCRTFGPSEWRY